jgi:4-aminobutyrate aminotransferase
MAGPHRSFFSNSGTEANEAALKLAKFVTGRHNAIAFFGAFHGRSMGSLSLTASKVRQRQGFGPLVPGVYHAPYPDVYRSGLSPEATADRCIEFIEGQLFVHLVSPEEVAAIVVEPIQGEGGYIVPPDSFLERLRAMATQHGIQLIVDEVQSGMGRTGKMFAIEHARVAPDIITIAKGIASGLPLGVTTAPSILMGSWPPGSHASTFGGNPVSCAAALATIALLRDSLVKNAEVVGAHLIEGARGLMDKHPLIGDVRGRGLMVGIELVRDRTTKERATAERDALVRECFNRGLLVLGAGRNAVRLSPPLVLTKQEADTALRILDEALTAIKT